MSRLHAVVFDLDGTLVHSAPGLHMAAAEMLSERGLPVPDLETLTGFVGRGLPTLVARCLDWAGADPAAHPAALGRYRALYGADPLRGAAPYPHAAAALADLRARGLRLGLCTNKPEGPARTMADGLGLGPFDAVAGGDTLAVRKPDPAPLLHVAALLGAAPDAVLYVGDSETDALTARAAGIRYVHVAGGYQRGPVAGLDPASVIADLSRLRTILDI